MSFPKKLRIVLAVLALMFAHVATAQTVDATTLSNKFILGYQAWHASVGDGSALNQYIHWSHNGVTQPGPTDIVCDLWPDLSEFTAGEQFGTGFTLGNGQPAKIYSCYISNTVVARHFKWMRDYGIDGVAVQRFTKDVFTSAQFAALKNTNLLNAKIGAETFGRVFFVMYDISNDATNLAFSHLTNDWAYIVNTIHATNSSRYLKHRGKPLVCIWGFGFNGGLAVAPSNALPMINYFKSAGCTVMGGLPADWRTLNGDSQTNSDWASVYRSFDVISPWTVGRYQTESQADSFKSSNIVPDLADCQSNHIDYLPVVFPGYSAHNLGGTALNQIPRNGGRFFWRQIYNTLTAGSAMLYGAMFDEIDEGTALYKIAPTTNEIPAFATNATYQFFALNADGFSLPSDWYLRVTQQGTLGAHGSIPVTATLPITPTNGITVTSPNGGQTWTAGTSANITWTSTGVLSRVNIDLSTDGGATFRSLLYDVTNSGSASISIPYYASTNCMVRVASTNGPPVDWSDARFTIQVTNSSTNIALTSLWSLAPGSRGYLPAGGNNSERGLAYDPIKDELFVVFASGGASANILDGTTGTDKGTLNTTGVSGGGFFLDKIGVTLDGIIYVGNVSVPGASFPPTFKLYRWADSNPATVPTVAYSGSAGFGNGIRLGDLMALRGCGTNTQILLAGRGANTVALLSTADGSNFTAQTISTDTTALQLGGALAFGPGYSFWSATNGLTPNRLNFDPTTLNATTVQSFSASAFPPSCGAMQCDAGNNLLAVVNLADGADQLNLYDLRNLVNGVPVLLSSWTFPGTWDNNFGLGAIAFGGNRLYALDTNNGLLAFKLNFPGGSTTLAASRFGARVGLSWPASARGFVLQQTARLPGTNWSCVCEPLWVSGTAISATQAVASGPVFYRLSKP